MSFQRPEGTNDILPGESEKWQFIGETARLLFRGYRHSEMRTLVFEHCEVISRNVGDTTDIASKETYDFYNKGECRVTLRSEGTAPIVCSFVEHKLFGPEYAKSFKTFYMGPMFRYERPQKGRLRQFHQIGVETFRSENPATDMESMVIAPDLFKQLGITQIRLVVNLLDDEETYQAYRQVLIDYLSPFELKLSEDSKRRLHESPLCVLDSKDKRDQKFVAEAPSILGYLSEPAQKHFDTVVFILDALAVPYEIDSNMVRGLDYCTHAIFEIMSDTPEMGAQATICAGRHYDNLVEELSGPSAPDFRFTMDIERLLLTMETGEVIIPVFNELDAYVVALRDGANIEALKVVQAIRSFGFSTDRDSINRRARAQLKTADKANAKLALVIGEDELASQTTNVKAMASRKEENFPLEEIYEHFNEVYDEMTLFE